MAEFEENKKSGLWKKVLKKIIKSPINSLFVIMAIYFASRAFVFSSTFSDKIAFYAFLTIWIIYILAKQIFFILILLLLTGAGTYLYYDYTHRDARQCEQNGGYWNNKEKICEEKKSSWERLRAFWDRNKQKQLNERSKK